MEWLDFKTQLLEWNDSLSAVRSYPANKCLINRQTDKCLQMPFNKLIDNISLLRYLLKLQTEEIQIHAEEMSNLRRELDDERSERIELEDRVTKSVTLNVTSFPGATSAPIVTSRPKRRRIKKQNDDAAAPDIRRQVLIKNNNNDKSHFWLIMFQLLCFFVF